MKIKMEIIPNSCTEEDGFAFCYGRITIVEKNEPEIFWETITPAINYWTIEDYERQWKEGLERIKTHPVSCLVSSIQNPYISNRLLDWWVLYKEGNEIFIRNQLIVGDSYKKRIGNKTFSPETCYDFIRPRYIPKENETVSEWIIDLE